MRTLACLSISALALLLGASAHAATVNYGGATNNSSCGLAGNSADRSCTNTISISNGANDGFASLNARGQASADHGITTNPTAIADLTVSYAIPYTVTRTVTMSQPPGPNNGTISFEVFDLTFDFTLSGAIAKDNSQTTGGLGQASFYGFTASSGNGYFSTASTGGGNLTGGGGLVVSPVNQTGPDRTYSLTLNFSGPSIGEIGPGDVLPTDFRSWGDLVNPQHPFTETDGATFTQTITDTLFISFRLRAESRPSGSLSTTGGEAIACMGQTSPLGGFDLDNGLNCGSGFTANASINNLSTVQIATPEPGVLALLGVGLAGLAVAAHRRRSR